MVKFIFDLDGTITAEETLPIIARHFNIEARMEELTRETIQGNIPFIESFIRRVHILGRLPVTKIAALLEQVGLHEQLHAFIHNNKENCAIATGNINCWVRKLIDRIGCTFFGSEALVEADRIIKLTKILKKEEIVRAYQKEGHQVVFIGDGNNDMEAMRLADVSIASGLTHYPAKSVLTVSDYLILNENALCRQLNQLLLTVPESVQD